MNSFRYALLTGTGAVCLFASAVSAWSTAVSDSSRGHGSLVPSMHGASATSVDAVSYDMPAAIARSTNVMQATIARSSNPVPSAPQPQRVSLSNTRVAKAVISDTMKLDILPPALISDRSEAINPLLQQPLACPPTHTASASQQFAHPSTNTPMWENAAQDTLVVAVLKQKHKLTQAVFQPAPPPTVPKTKPMSAETMPMRAPIHQKAQHAPVKAVRPAKVLARTTVTAPAAPAGTVNITGAPASLIPVYQAAGSRYGIPWTVLAAIHKTETDFRISDCPVSSEGAKGPMQFLPGTFAEYGVTAPGQSGPPNIENVDDAIYTAAHMLALDGYRTNPSNAIFAYNHSHTYVRQIETLAGI